MASEYLRETSFAHMTRKATEARAQGIAEWIAEHVDPRRRYKSPKEASKLRKELRPELKALAGRHYQLLLSTRQSRAICAARLKSSLKQVLAAWKRANDSPGITFCLNARRGNLRARRCGSCREALRVEASQGRDGRPVFQRRAGRESGAVFPS